MNPICELVFPGFISVNSANERLHNCQFMLVKILGNIGQFMLVKILGEDLVILIRKK